MRIVHVTDVYAPDVGGIERQVEALVGRQRAAGHEVVVVTTVSGAVAAQRAGDVRVASHLPGDRWADVVHGHLSVVSPLALRLGAGAARRGTPVAFTVHSLWPAHPLPIRSVLRGLGGMPSPVTWSAVSRVAAERVGRTVRAPVWVVPNGVDTAWWARPAGAARGNGLGAASGMHLVLVNRLAGRKRVGRFLTALGRRPPAGVRITIVGDGPRRDDIAATVRRLGLADRVTLTGVLPPTEVRALLHTADLFVAPSRLESFGIAALEARAAGVPVLGFRGTGIADLVSDGHDGRLVGSDAEMVDVVGELAAHPAWLAAWQDAAAATPPTADMAWSVAAVNDLYRVAGARTSPAQLRPPLPTGARP